MENQTEYTISGKLAERLEIMAAKAGSTPESLLKSVVSQYLGRHFGFPEGMEERRAFKRLDISIPAMLYYEEDGDSSVLYQPASIRDVSPGGMRVACAGRKLCGRLAAELSAELEFDIIFAFSEEMEPVRFRCRSVRMEIVEEELHIGARIVGSDAEGRAMYEKIAASNLCRIVED